MLPLMDVAKVTKRYKNTTAVNQVSFSVMPDEALGLVGESGCGKSTLANMILGLTEPTAGAIFFQGIPLGKMRKEERLDYRRRVQLIFQDTKASLN